MPGKEIFDAIHGYIYLNELALSFCDTPEFQRLAFIKQLGTSSFVFPCADHTRKAHSFGCYHLASIMVKQLRSRHPNVVSVRDVELIGVAALMHDVGHGPFSHVFDKILENVPGAQSHETRSCEIVRRICARKELQISVEEIQVICDMILPPADMKNNWKYQIVSGSVDADRCDYIVRDSKNVGVTTPFGLHNVHRIISHMYISDDALAFSPKVSRDIIELLSAREALHEKVYQHRVSLAIEYMVVDAINLADPNYLYRSQICCNPDIFISLSDSYLLELATERNNSDASRNLINRIFARDLYSVKDEDYSTEQPQRESSGGTIYVQRWMGISHVSLHGLHFSEPLRDKPLTLKKWRISTIQKN